MAKGIGKGIGGVFFKPPAGMIHLACDLLVDWLWEHSSNSNFRSLGTRWVSVAWASQKASNITGQDSGIFYHCVSHRTRG